MLQPRVKVLAPSIRALLRELRRLVARRSSYKFFMKSVIPPADTQAAAEVIRTMRFTKNIDPVLQNGPSGKRLTVIAPHCDDEAIGPGGTISMAVADGAEVNVIYLTPTTNKPNETLVGEAKASAACMGCSVRFMSHPVRNIPVDDKAAQDFGEVLLERRPSTIMLPFLLDDHDDHRRANQLLLQASRVVGLPKDIQIWAYQVYSVVPGNVVVDITMSMERKAEAIRMYESQLARRDWVHYALGVNAMNVRLLHSENRPRYVEAFFVVPLSEYLDICELYFDRDVSQCYDEPNYQA